MLIAHCSNAVDIALALCCSLAKNKEMKSKYYGDYINEADMNLELLINLDMVEFNRRFEQFLEIMITGMLCKTMTCILKYCPIHQRYSLKIYWPNDLGILGYTIIYLLCAGYTIGF
jgi:hypothetical protein